MTMWNDDMLIDVPKIDEQHRGLTKAIDDLAEACEKNRGEDYIRKTLLYIANYTKEHFADEEKIQEECEFPHIRMHKKQHSDFVATATELIMEYSTTEEPDELAKKICKILIDWVTNHIRTEDKKIGEYIKENQTKL